jgi:hypothetical protein
LIKIGDDMITNSNKISINWEVEIPQSHFMKLYGRGAFVTINNSELLLTFNEDNENNVLRKGKLVALKDGVIKELFVTESMLWASVLDANEIFLVTSCVSFIDSEIKGIIFKLDKNFSLEWQYELDGSAASLPVIYNDSIIVTDYVRSIERGNIYRLNRNGELISKKQLQGFCVFEPWILKGKNQIIVGYNKPKMLEILDFYCNSLKTKSTSDLGNILFSENAEGHLFGAINNGIVALNDNLNILWEHKSIKGFSTMAPVFDQVGNLYSLLSNRTLVSLDGDGKERWTVDLLGFGYQPCILNKENIVTITSEPSGRSSEEEQFITYLNVFSASGKQVAYHELPGYIFHTARINDDTFVLATNCTQIDVEKESHINSIKVFSLKISQ